MSFVQKMAVMVVLVVAASPSQAQGDEEKNIEAAKEFLGKEARLKGVLFFAHPTASYSDYDYVETAGVVEKKTGKKLKGYFAITYKVSWTGLFKNDETTIFDFFFDDKGKLLDLKAKSTGSFEPFGATNVVIAALKDKIIDYVDKNGTEDEKISIRQLIKDGDAKALLVWLLKNNQ